MKTDALIELLARDSRRQPPLAMTALTALAVALIAAWTGLVFSIGIRPDAGTAIETPRFLFKFVFSGAVGLSATWLAIRASRPGAQLGPPAWGLAASVLLLGGAVLGELSVVPPAAWLGQMIGTNARICLTGIPLLAVAPLAVFLLLMRRGAPSSPALAGAACGLAAGAVAAMAYATYCPDDSPLFVAAWYPIAVSIVAAAGALLGSKILRW